NNLSYLFLCNWHKKYSFSIRIVISEFLPKKSYFLPKTQTNLHYLLSNLTFSMQATGRIPDLHRLETCAAGRTMQRAGNPAV
ncbi:hypothetical protein, partial [Blautia marasmi]|uniref:hypothetical protein n=1 Tax=Blautia marasmi TaxID=1917868 RepID=UPI003514B81D